MDHLCNEVFALICDNNSQKENPLLRFKDEDLDSYFENDKFPEQSSFSFIDADNVDSLKQEFEKIIGANLPNMPKEVYEKLAKIAFDLKSTAHVREEEALSEAVYVMF